ncbi:MAG: amidase family protein, partial [Actinomycetota bacterium]
MRDWLEAWREPTLAQARLLALRTEVVRAAEAASGRAVWIHLCPEAAWTTQIEGVRRRVVEAGGPLQAIARYPLLGVPFAVKDHIAIAGEPTTAACPAFAQTAAEHATVVQRLLDAGALWLGKTNLDQFATGLVGTRSPHGMPRNPAHPGLVPGGSSSASAVAVARGLVPFALGTDTAGSGRVPAALCEVVGIKPTPGRVPSTGCVPAVRRIDCVTVFASTVADGRAVGPRMAGPHPRDPWSSSPGPVIAPVRRLGVPLGLSAVCDPPAAAAFAAHVAALASAPGGPEVVEVDIGPLLEVGSWLYGGPFTAERAVAVGDFLSAGPPDADPVVASIITGSMTATATEAYAAEYRLAAARRDTAAMWGEVDALLLPTVPGVTTPELVAADPFGANSALGRFTTFTNLLGMAAVAFPAPRRDDGMPHGVQLLGPAWSDEPLADLAMWMLGEVAAPPSPTPVG